jgi:hypothetical protein
MNGALQANASGTYLPSKRMAISGGVGGVGFFSGAVDELRIYDQALTAGDITNLFKGVTTPPPNCVPLKACAAGATCGTQPDGCGGTISCGTCSSPQTCGGGGQANACGCTPTTCSAQGANCGTVADGCGGTLTCGAACGGGPVPVGPAFYVATNGNDSNAGTLAAPFASLAKAQAAMRASSSIKTTYIRAGHYTPPVAGGDCLWGNSAGSSIGLGSADSGETWSYYPPDGVGSAILDGQSTIGSSGPSGGNGTGCAFGASDASNVTITGLQFQNYQFSAFWGYQVPNLLFTNNDVHNLTSAAFAAAGVAVVASQGTNITNNYLHDIAYMGIRFDDNSATGNMMSNNTVANNVVINSCTWPSVSNGGNDQNGGDCGALYSWSSATTVSTNNRITNNWVADVNVSSNGKGDWGMGNAVGIYLDDGVNNVTVSGNVVLGIKSACFLIHGGQNNVMTGNLCDLGVAGPPQEIVFYQNDGMTQMLGNLFQNNIVVAGSSGGGAGFFADGPPNPMTIKNNAYFNYVGAAINSTGGAGGNDANPTYENPNLSCWSPSVAAGSPVFNAPVSFPGLPGGWGPPGFKIPQTGSAPSWPHGCP